jgi:hypothetical protein
MRWVLAILATSLTFVVEAKAADVGCGCPGYYGGGDVAPSFGWSASPGYYGAERGYNVSPGYYGNGYGVGHENRVDRRVNRRVYRRGY